MFLSHVGIKARYCRETLYTMATAEYFIDMLSYHMITQTSLMIKGCIAIFTTMFFFFGVDVAVELLLRQIFFLQRSQLNVPCRPFKWRKALPLLPNIAGHKGHVYR